MDKLTANQIKSVELYNAGRYGEALALIDSALKKWRTVPQLWNNRGTVMLAIGRFEDAAFSYQRALNIAPELSEIMVPLSTCLQALGRYYEAIKCCETVLLQQPDHPQAHWNLSMLLLLTGDYRRGWQEYEWRWQTGRFPFITPVDAEPQWRGENISGKTILIRAEQGFGDTIQFCRYLLLLIETGAEIIFSCAGFLHDLISTLSSDIRLVAPDEPSPKHDCHCHLLSLPLIFSTTPETIPLSVGYLSANPDRRVKWRRLVPSDDRLLKTGLCWHGRVKPDPRRSCPAAELNPLVCRDDISCYSLQLGDVPARPHPPLIDLTSRISDFADTAALIAELDLVITIDTSVAHLAGALGKPCWVLLPIVPDWRWGLEGTETPWYDSLKLFRQHKPDDWRGVITSVASTLTEFAQAR